MEILDCHRHATWGIQTPDEYDEYPVSPYSATPEDHIKSMDEAGISKGALTSWLGIVYDFREGDEDLKKAVDKHPNRLIPYCTVNPRWREESIHHLRRCIGEYGWRLVKIYPIGHDYLIDECPSLDILAEEMIKLGVRDVMTHGGLGESTRPWRIGRFAERFPDLQIHMAHTAVNEWYDAIDWCEKVDNLVIDTSGSWYWYGEFDMAVERIGPDRVLFGTDWPCNYNELNISKIMDSELSQSSKRRIIGENFKRILGL